MNDERMADGVRLERLGWRCWRFDVEVGNGGEIFGSAPTKARAYKTALAMRESFDRFIEGGGA